MPLNVPDAQSHEFNSENLLTILEWKIRTIPVSEGPLPPGKIIMEESKTLEIFQLALLVYIERASGSSPGQSENMRSRLNRAFVIFSQVKTWQRQFPLLILGCEARADEDRIVVLDLISRTEENTNTRNLRGMKDILQSLWT